MAIHFISNRNIFDVLADVRQRGVYQRAKALLHLRRVEGDVGEIGRRFFGEGVDHLNGDHHFKIARLKTFEPVAHFLRRKISGGGFEHLPTPTDERATPADIVNEINRLKHVVRRGCRFRFWDRREGERLCSGLWRARGGESRRRRGGSDGRRGRERLTGQVAGERGDDDHENGIFFIITPLEIETENTTKDHKRSSTLQRERTARRATSD